MAASKVRVVKKTIGVDDPAAFVELLAAALSKGELDTVLAALWEAVDGRIRQYMGADGENLDEAFLAALHGAKRFYEAPELEVGGRYFLRGDKYRDVVVEFLGFMPAQDGQPGKARVRIIRSNYKSPELNVGDTFQLPAGALISMKTNGGAFANPKTRTEQIR